jgi:hypothetical protein
LLAFPFGIIFDDLPFQLGGLFTHWVTSDRNKGVNKNAGISVWPRAARQRYGLLGPECIFVGVVQLEVSSVQLMGDLFDRQGMHHAFRKVGLRRIWRHGRQVGCHADNHILTSGKVEIHPVGLPSTHDPMGH